MDPDANIAAQRDLIARLRADPGDQDARTDLAELLEACGAGSQAADSAHRTGLAEDYASKPPRCWPPARG